jgi:hypothetical protein
MGSVAFRRRRSRYCPRLPFGTWFSHPNPGSMAGFLFHLTKGGSLQKTQLPVRHLPCLPAFCVPHFELPRDSDVFVPDPRPSH